MAGNTGQAPGLSHGKIHRRLSHLRALVLFSFILFTLFSLLSVLGIELGALCVQGQSSTLSYSPSPFLLYFSIFFFFKFQNITVNLATE